jgi:exopolysaccharide production protein ExoZ
MRAPSARIGAAPSPVARARGQRLQFIQYLRGLAALAVVVHHVTRSMAPQGSRIAELDLGHAGVLVFFVISGFVMSFACAGESPATFAMRRIIRVVPLYWVMTLVYFAILERNDIAAGTPFLRLPHLMESLFFVPHFHLRVPDAIWPVLVQGWTLNYEMFFFLIFFVGIALHRPRIFSMALLVLLLAIGLAFGPVDPRLVTWTSPLLLLFLAGVLLAEARMRVSLARLVWALPLGIGAMALGSGGVFGGVLIIGIGAVLVLLGTLALQERLPDVHLRWLGALGDASYSIYLSHTLFLLVLFKGLAFVQSPFWVKALAATLLSTGLGYLVYIWLERPMIAGLRARADTLITKRNIPARPA